MGSYKKLGWTDEDVRCPFYISNDRAKRSICCEGYGKGIDTISRFRSFALKNSHMGRLCAGYFEECPVYQCTYKSKYQGEKES